MYVPKQFEETRTDVLHALIRERPFGTLVAMTEDGLSVDHIPFFVDGATGPLGVLRGHVARANPLLRATLADADAVAIFQGPNAYITPSWYATKKETGKVVPTWNYVVVHAYGRPEFVEDERWLRDHLNHLTDSNELTRESPWKVSDAPDDYIAKLIGGIVGVEIPIARLSGKWKLGQNRSKVDQRGMVDGLLREEQSSAHDVAALIRQAEESPK